MTVKICTKELLEEMDRICKSSNVAIPIKDEPTIKLGKLSKSEVITKKMKKMKIYLLSDNPQTNHYSKSNKDVD